MKINRERVKNNFIKLVQIDAPSFHERQMADEMIRQLTDLGFTVEEDNVGKEFYGSDTGNLYAYLEGDLPGPPILLAGHMDTVDPGIGKKPIIQEDGDTITSDGTTVLGADDMSGVCAILEGIRVLRENKIPHRSIEILLTIAEEAYVRGAWEFDYSKIKADEVYVLDISGPTGSATSQAPSIIKFTMTVTGRSAHAGFAPETGIHAIKYMSEIISAAQMGHIDWETTFNVGSISGGAATNIVPETCTCIGEARSLNHDKAVAAIEAFHAKALEIAAGNVSIDIETECVSKAYKFDEEEAFVQRFVKAAKMAGMPGTLEISFGGSDNNVFADHGLKGMVLSTGMYNAHSIHEYTKISDIVKAAEIIANILTLE